MLREITEREREREREREIITYIGGMTTSFVGEKQLVLVSPLVENTDSSPRNIDLSFFARRLDTMPQ